MNRIAWAILAFVLPAVAAAGQVRTIELLTVECEVVAIAGDDVTIATADGQRRISCDDISEVVLAPDAYDPQADPMQRRGATTIVTVYGDVLDASVNGMAETVLSFDSSLTGRHEVDIRNVSAIYLSGRNERPGEIADACRQMEIDTGSSDRLLVRQPEGGDLSVLGALLSITDEPLSQGSPIRKTTITFTWQGAERKMSAENVRAILLADVADREIPLAGHVIGADGSRIGFTAIELLGDEITIDSPALGTLTIARENVAAIRFVSHRVVHLADLDPTAVEERGMIIDPLAHRRNHSVGGGPLRLDGVIYATGLGLHSFTELTYDIDGEFSSFVAVVGIDDSVRPNGDAALTIYGDGERLIGPMALTGEAPGVTIRCELDGVRQLTIRVDFGDDGLGVADHVDLAGASLIK